MGHKRKKRMTTGLKGGSEPACDWGSSSDWKCNKSHKSRCNEHKTPSCGGANLKSHDPCERCHLDEIACFFERRGHRRRIKLTRTYLQKIKHVLLRIPQVSAVDAGFLFCESKCRYVPQVGIRIHFEIKESHKQPNLNCWPEIPRHYFQQMLCLLGTKRFWVLDKCKGNRSKPRASSQFRSHKMKFDCCVCVLIKDRHNKYRRLYIDLVPARYQAAAHGIRTERPIPNTEGFHDEAIARLGRYPVNPLVGGISVGNPQGSAGTLGMVVWDTKDGAPCILSNWHVLSGVPGSRIGQPVYQPALFDGGRPERDRVGCLKRWLFDSHGDAALAQIDNGISYESGEILGLWLPIWEAVQPRLGMEVRKWGRASGFTKGFIDGIDMAVKVEYSNVGFQEFDCQFRIAPICAGQEVTLPGDSGAVWVTKAQIDTVPHELRAYATGYPHKNFHKKKSKARRLQVYFGVCLQFAGDVPGSSLREHAVASSLHDLSHRLHFSLRPVFHHPDNIVAQPEPRRLQVATRDFTSEGRQQCRYPATKSRVPKDLSRYRIHWADIPEIHRV